MNLILNFDINKTIIVSDASTSRGVDASLHSLLSEVCWGHFSSSIPREDRSAADWIPVLEYPSCQPPSDCAVTFGAYLEDHTMIAKSERRRLKTSFAMPGETGHCFSKFLQQLQEKISVKLNNEGTENANSETSSSSTNEQQRNQHHFILPSFFHLLDYLFSEKVLATVNWRIVFRSFGIDTAEVVKELNSFLQGTHSIFVPANLSETSKCHISLPQDTGALIRTGPNEEDVQLACVNQNNVVTTVVGAKNIQHYIHDVWLEMSTPNLQFPLKRMIILRDDYRWWEKNNEADNAGKLLLIDSRSLRPENQQPHEALWREEVIYQVFFDDNIERDRPHIVDCRDKNTFDAIPFHQTKDDILIRAEPYLAILDENYFVNNVKGLIFRWSNSH